MFKKGLAGFAATAIMMTLLDLLWLGVIARDFYARHLGSLLAAQTVWPAAAAFYLFYVSSIWLVAVRNSPSAKKSWHKGAAMGAFAYGVYELTNWAVIANWPPSLVPIDWAWGIVLTGSCACCGRWVSEKV